MKKDLAIIGASYLQLPLIERAKALGYRTHVFAWAADDVGEKAADVFYPISIVEKEAIAGKCKEIGICGICSIASDLAMLTVNYVADRLGLPGNSLACTRKSTNKHLMRQAFLAGGDPSPKSLPVDASTDLSALLLSYPVIVKPTDRSGSRGICKVEAPAQLEEAVRCALSQGFEKKALIEEFAEGQEYSVEGISFEGKHTILAITQKFTTGAPHFIETGHREPAPLDEETQEKVRRIVLHALDSLEITTGASHSEIKIDEKGNVKIIEIGARMGGDCIGSDLVWYSTGIDYVKAVIDTACGQAPDLTAKHEPIPVEVKFLFTREDVLEMERLRGTDRFIRLADYAPQHLGAATDSSNRAGCYLIRV